MQPSLYHHIQISQEVRLKCVGIVLRLRVKCSPSHRGLPQLGQLSGVVLRWCCCAVVSCGGAAALQPGARVCLCSAHYTPLHLPSPSLDLCSKLLPKQRVHKQWIVAEWKHFLA